MITIFNFSFPMPAWLNLQPTFVSFVLSLLAWSLIIILVYIILTFILKKLFRRLPGEVEDILLGIGRKPLLILVITFGLVRSLEVLPLQPNMVSFLDRALKTTFIVIVMYIFWRLIKDILVYYGRIWARKTETKIDDNLLPILNIFGPILIIVIAVFLILPMWGLDVSSALVGAGVIGLVLGLALQDSLSNLFSGMSLVVEAAYRVGDLLQMEDGSVCEVEDFGLRTTQLYSLDNHCTIYMPNKTLANASIINITKPTVEQRSNVDVQINSDEEILKSEEHYQHIAESIPGVLVSDIRRKIKRVQSHYQVLQHRLVVMDEHDPIKPLLKEEARRYRLTIAKLRKEQQLNHALLAFKANLESLAKALTEREVQGFSSLEKQEIKQKFVPPTEQAYKKLLQTALVWMAKRDPFTSLAEHRALINEWERRNERLANRWNTLVERMRKPEDPTETRLDDMSLALANWLGTEYKLLPEPWKDPKVAFKSFEGKSIQMQLWFYVDNIRLEHDGRLQRVRTDIARRIREEKM
jgi:MscS family membrane protein